MTIMYVIPFVMWVLKSLFRRKQWYFTMKWLDTRGEEHWEYNSRSFKSEEEARQSAASSLSRKEEVLRLTERYYTIETWVHHE